MRIDDRTSANPFPSQTALSQSHNLYFVAHGRDIYVYEPHFPTQTLSEQPSLIVPSQPSSPGLRGYLDPRDPHTINNLIVQRLGNDEVIATVRDDGDVDAVLVRHVVHAIRRRAEPGSTIGVLADELRPIFHDNVGISAWGLAIHSQARILAISSNAHEVRVFKFGLLVDEQQAGSNRPLDDVQVAPHRKMDVTQRVLNGDANIPHISFCNTGDDPTARWLLTTDISGYCRVMDLHSSMYNAEPTVQQFRFGRSFVGYRGDFDRLNAGWAIMFLDTRSFQREDDFHTALGLREGEGLPGANGVGRMWDLSDTVENVPENSRAFTYNAGRKRRDLRRSRQGSAPVSNESERTETPAEQPSDSTEVALTDPESPDGGVELLNIDDGDSPTADEEENRTDAEPTSEHSSAEPEDDLSYEPLSTLIGSDDDDGDEGTEDSLSFRDFYGGKRIFANQPYFSRPHAALCHDLPCPILHASVKNVYLLQPSHQRHTPGPLSPPMLGLANPLRQAISPHFAPLNLRDRLNMHASIPSLGIVVLASQKGRALVLSLTKLPPGTTRSLPDIAHRTTYAMRVECILPLASQEAASQRPFAPLHGIAAGPMQGTEAAPEHRRRWLCEDR